jgi:arylamine N-acetyltransferase
MIDRIDPYFRRISYTGPREPTLATLNGIVAAHVAAIPFENLDVLRGMPILLDADAVFQKLVVAGRGGYTSAHPQSHFKNRLMVARSTPVGGRITLLNTQLTHRHRDGQLTVVEITTPEELLGVLIREFGLQFPEGTRFDAGTVPWPWS